MRIVTYNLWHGLSPSTPLAFEALEADGRRQLRERLQREILRELKPDVCFFQEVNPVKRRSPELSRALAMDATYQPDLVGLKLFGVGLPVNLNSGLVTLAKPAFGLRKLEGASLSRPNAKWVQSWGSWQLKEERFALFSEAMMPGWGRVLLINTHLHHGLESTPDFVRRLDELAEEMELSPKIISEVKGRLSRGSERRAQEINELLNVLEKHQRRYEVVILGGDFNASPEGDFGLILKSAGFHDVWAKVHPEGGGLSYDSSQNQANHLLQSRFPLTLVVEDLSFSSKTKEALLKLAREQESRPRRIDYLWMRTNTLALKPRAARLIGQPDAEGLAASDHFGVCADFELG